MTNMYIADNQTIINLCHWYWKERYKIIYTLPLAPLHRMCNRNDKVAFIFLPLVEMTKSMLVSSYRRPPFMNCEAFGRDGCEAYDRLAPLPMSWACYHQRSGNGMYTPTMPLSFRYEVRNINEKSLSLWRKSTIMDKNTTEIIASYLQKVMNEQPDLISAYLFGSYARNNQRSESDIDIALFFKTLPESDRFQTQVKLMLLAAKIDNRIEPHPLSKSDLNSNNPFAEEILKTGIRLQLKS